MSLSPVPFTSSSLIPSTDASPSSRSSKSRGKQIKVEKTDRISELNDDLLLRIISNVDTKDAIKTSVLSPQWKNLWKQMPSLVFDDIEKTIKFWERRQTDVLASMITKVIEDHNGYLDCCEIEYLNDQHHEDGTLKIWIQSLTQVKHTKSLALRNINRAPIVLQLSPNIFSHPSLTSLALRGYNLESAQAFNNSHNLMTLRLDNICAEIGVFNTVIASCPSLKVLLLEIRWYSQNGCLKIHLNNLKMLNLTCTPIDGIDVSTPLLDIFAIHCDSVTRSNILLKAPRMLGIRKYYSILDKSIYYNVSSDAQEIKNILRELVKNSSGYLEFEFENLVVNVDLMNPQEIYMLKEVCDVWGRDIDKLVIFFKHNKVPKKRK